MVINDKGTWIARYFS